MEQPQEIFRCSQCRMEYYTDGFNVDRLGRRRKGCKKCSALNRSYRARRVPLKCEHGKITYQCAICKPESYVLKVITKRIGRALTTEERASRPTADLLGCTIPELIDYLHPQLDAIGVTWGGYDDNWLLAYRLHMRQDDDGKYRVAWEDETGRWVRATVEHRAERLHYTNLVAQLKLELRPPPESKPGKTKEEIKQMLAVRRAVRNNHLTDEELADVLAGFGF